MEKVNFYYSDELSNDLEGNLVQLCDECYATNRDIAQWASAGDAECECELCDACNDPTGREWLNRASADAAINVPLDSAPRGRSVLFK